MAEPQESNATLTALHERLQSLSYQLREAMARGCAGEAPEPSAKQAIDRLLDEQKAVLQQLARASSDQVTELSAALQEQRALNNRLAADQFVFRYVLAHLPHRIWWKDREGRFLGGNENFIRDVGHERMDNLLGKTDYDLGFTREQADFYRNIDRRVMETGESLLDIEEPQQRPDGLHTLTTSKAPLRNEAGEIVGTLGIFVDITERKRMEEALQQAKEAAEAAARAKGDFLTTISHELRTPLTLILGPIESLLADTQGMLPPDIRRSLERIHRNATRLYDLVNDVLAFARTEAGWMEVQWEAVDITALVRRIVEDAALAAQQKKIDLQFVVEQEPGLVPLDRAKYEKVVLNLVGNALKFTPEGGSVSLRLRDDEGHIRLSIADTGPGIPLEKQGLIFERFQQIDSSTTRRYEGTGIGLALVKEFTELMGGEVGLRSSPGSGSCFFVRTPRSPDRVANLPRSTVTGDRRTPHLPAPAPPESAAVSANSTGPRILIAEDNADMRGYLIDLLSPHFEVEAVENGRLALLAARRRAPEVIISDVMMPEMDGYELVRAVKSDEALQRTPVILLTAKAGREEIVGGLAVGADDYLPKPFGPGELRARIEAAVRMHGLTTALEDEQQALQTTLTELQSTQEQLVHAGKLAAVGTLVAGLSHELNNPLGSILLHTQSLLKRAAPDTREHSGLLAIDRQARRCAQLVRTLLDVSRKKSAEQRATPVTELLQRVMDLIGAEALRRGIALSRETSGVDGVVVEGSPEELETAILNLLSNALDATAQGGSVSLVVRDAIRQQEPGIEIDVQDTGSGIPPEALPRIFEPFFTLKPQGRGTGLGLSLTQRIVESHRGEIRVESTPGRGTRFSIWLPARSHQQPVGNEASC